MSTHTFLWHDYETFGLHTRRDRPAQFAGIRTDADLNEIGEPIELYCQPHADYLPDPTSCLLTGITPEPAPKANMPKLGKEGATKKDFEGLTIHGVERVEEAINLVRGLG